MKRLVLVLLLGCYTSAFAMFCPNGFNQMNYGDTIEQVQKECGKPDEQVSKKVEPMGPQEWSYYITQPPIAPLPSGPQASIKLTVAFDKGKVVNITSNGLSFGSTNICGNIISMGDSAESVKASCGNPSAINKSGTSDGEKPTEVTEFRYSSATPPATLIFENGKLTQRK